MINKKIISLFLFAFVLLFACEKEPTPPEPDTYGSLSGVVIDVENESPYYGAVVASIVNQKTDTTDSSGQFILDSLLTGIDSILVVSEIHDSLLTIVDILEGVNELTLTPDRLPCFDDRPAEDTTRVYQSANSGAILELVPSLIIARFDTSIKDSMEILDLISKYGLKQASEGMVYGLDGLGWSGIFCSTVGLRAEYYFTPYGKDNFCNFGADPLVDYSFGVFDGTTTLIFGRVGILFLNGTPEATALSLIESYGLRFLRRSSALTGDDPGYSTIITKKSKKNVLDLGFDLNEEKLIDYFIQDIVSGYIGEPPMITCD